MSVDLRQTVADWKWNIWEMDLKTGKRKKWLGSITDPHTGFTWLRAKGFDLKKYRINNVPPETSHSRMPEREVYSTDGKTVQVGDRLAPRHVPGKFEDFTPRPVRKPAATPKRTPARPDTSTVTTRKAVPKPAPVPDTPEMKKVKGKAKDLLDQHKAAEKKDIEEGRTDAVR